MILKPVPFVPAQRVADIPQQTCYTPIQISGMLNSFFVRSFSFIFFRVCFQYVFNMGLNSPCSMYVLLQFNCNLQFLGYLVNCIGMNIYFVDTMAQDCLLLLMEIMLARYNPALLFVLVNHFLMLYFLRLRFH